ncbi:MAG: glycoside hydrolase family 88 protein [Eubacteriales bacterium]|nr:glycoside hydrolase family 88 protein [Eubacteriales bacterium]
MVYQEIAQRVMSKLVSTHQGGGENDHLTLDTWEWPQGVAMYAMFKVWLANGDPQTLLEIKNWYAIHLQKGLPKRNINTTAPMLAMTLLYEATHDPQYEKPIEEWAQWVMDSLPRTEERGFQHITTHDENHNQLWDDTLYMTVLFLYRAGVALHQPAWCDEAKYQFLLHIKYLHCPGNGLWYHGFTFDGRHHFGGAFWARGNSWFTAGAIDFVEWLEKDDCIRRLVTATWQEHCAALVRLQDPQTGLWHTLLDQEDSYLETSASAAISYGLLKGVRLGLLPKEAQAAAERGLNGVLGQVQPDGTVDGVSYGTPMGKDLDFYRQIPLCPTAYGQGLVFLMLTEKLANR